MNLKGIKITKKMCRKISEIGVLNLKTTMLNGLPEFKKFTWSSFNKQEFSGLINSMSILLNAGIFNTIGDSQLFIFNYYTDVTEMDIATVLTNKDNKNVIINVEYKTEELSDTKLDEQLIKRIQEHMPQLFINDSYVLIAMNENGFYRANYYDSTNNIDINDIVDLKKIFSDFRDNEYVEPILTQANDLACIHNLYSKMESGDFKYYEETKRTTEFILNKIHEGVKTVVCLSKPGTGKTVAAFKLFFENEDFVFLIMNQKFYNSLGLIKYFAAGRCYFGSDTFLKQNLSNKIVIVDEVQRLNKETILKIVTHSKAAILFGDPGQAFMPNDLELDGHRLVEYLRNNNIYVYNKDLKRSKRYNDMVEKALNFLSSRAGLLKENIEIEDYKINIFYDSKEFLKSYHSCKGGKKMFTTYDNRLNSSVIIGNEKFYIADKEIYSFAIIAGLEEYIGHTLHAISFDVENNYIYLNNIKVINKKGKDILFNKNGNLNNEEEITKFLNELNILFTRGKKSLNIYTEDFEVYLYLNQKLKSIYQKN